MLQRLVKKKKGGPPAGDGSPNQPLPLCRKTLRFIKQSFLYSCIFQMRFNLNKVLAVMPEVKWAEMSSNEQMSSKELEWV